MLLSQVLFAFANDFDRQAGMSLALCANAIRVLGREPVGEAEIPRLTGSSPETSGIGWHWLLFGVGRGRLPRARVGKSYGFRREGSRCSRSITCWWRRSNWNGRTSTASVRLEVCGNRSKAIREQRDGDRSRLSAGLVPPVGVVRAGDPVYWC